MKQSDTTKLESLLKQVSEEMINLRKNGYEVDIKLPNDFATGCSLSVYKPVVILENDFSYANNAT